MYQVTRISSAEGIGRCAAVPCCKWAMQNQDHALAFEIELGVSTLNSQ
jgi:hypothetical protein